MRISELGRAAGVPVATVKYYLREGLLPPGVATAANQADYGPEHIHRLRLIRVLIEVGDLGLATIRKVLAAIDDGATPMHELLGIAHHALETRTDESETPDVVAARGETDAFLDELGWHVSPGAPARRDLAASLAALRRLGWDAGPAVFTSHARAADELAAREVGRVARSASRVETVERAVIGTIVFETALIALRRLAQEHHSATAWAQGAASSSGPSPT